MVVVNEIWDEVKKLVGNSSDDFAFRRITDAVELLAQKGDFDHLIGTLDTRAHGTLVTLPNDVEVILGLNMLGRPAAARDALYEYHLNGPGSCGKPIRFEFMNQAESPIFREIACAGKLWGYCTDVADVNAELWVTGLDENQNEIYTTLSDGSKRRGWKVPVTVDSQAQPSDAPNFFTITSVQKPVTKGPLRLTILNGTEEILLGIYQAYETVPLFRRIKISRSCSWLRLTFRRRQFAVRSRYDLLPIAPKQAVVMMLRAMKSYDEPGNLALAEAQEATAVRWMKEKQHSLTPATVQPLQVLDGADALADQHDHID